MLQLGRNWHFGDQLCPRRLCQYGDEPPVADNRRTNGAGLDTAQAHSLSPVPYLLQFPEYVYNKIYSTAIDVLRAPTECAVVNEPHGLLSCSDLYVQ
jgi:hypothetical protein